MTCSVKLPHSASMMTCIPVNNSSASIELPPILLRILHEKVSSALSDAVTEPDCSDNFDARRKVKARTSPTQARPLEGGFGKGGNCSFEGHLVSIPEGEMLDQRVAAMMGSIAFRSAPMYSKQSATEESIPQANTSNQEQSQGSLDRNSAHTVSANEDDVQFEPGDKSHDSDDVTDDVSFTKPIKLHLGRKKKNGDRKD
uniref:Uncharacterized protein n=1 Tax=Palpitomonas bilix TaxID=652834 RepID=A0A7S3G707_9EUKA|mmetsp:Transcript_34963/g.90585  ORF Transcript_34963/g.90585 Transcript_34963/m.90585 type:complete len:199 (+) Transcript_34963:324-920(+)